MLLTPLLEFLVAIQRTDQVLDVVKKTFTVSETSQQHRLAAVRALGLALLDPGPKTILAGQFRTGWTHFGLAHILETDVALKHAQLAIERRSWFHCFTITVRCSNMPFLCYYHQSGFTSNRFQINTQ